MILSVIAESPPPFPFPISGQITINGYAQEEGYETQLKNLDTGEVIYMKVRNGAYYFPNLNEDLTLGYTPRTTIRGTTYPGDTLRITVCSGSPECVWEFELIDASPIIHNFIVTIGGWTPPVVPEGEETKITDGIIEAYFGQAINVQIGHNKLERLLDTKIKFDGEDYDAEESLSIQATSKTSIDDKDFGLEPYIILSEGGIKYRYEIDNTLDITKITEDEPLRIALLGEDVEITRLTSTEMDIIAGNKYTVKEKQTVEGVLIDSIVDDVIFVIYQGESKKITEGDTERIGDLEIYASEVLDDDEGDDIAVVRIANDVHMTVNDGDDYNDEEVFRWDIGDHYIGVENQQDYDDIDDEYKPLKKGDTFALPNNYVGISFDDVTSPKTYELTFKVKDNYLMVDGDFEKGIKSYDRVYVKGDGIYDRDNSLIDSSKVIVGTSGTYLQIGSAVIGKLKILLDMADILYDGVSYANSDDDILDHLGIIFKDCQNAVDDKSGFKVIVPDERPEIKIKVTGGIISIPEKPPMIEPEPPVIPIEPVIPPTPAEPVTPTEPVVPVEPTTRYVCPDKSEVESPEQCPAPQGIDWVYATFITIVGMVLVALGAKYKWLKGFASMWKKKAELAKTPEEKKKVIESGIKAVKTVIQKDKEGKYKS